MNAALGGEGAPVAKVTGHHYGKDEVLKMSNLSLRQRVSVSTAGAVLTHSQHPSPSCRRLRAR